ncbi:MAG: MFS transporter [Candidatus Lokiarchaeota archaeon]|nr:MFS transporter [Candidatus Lokiarchaeota archaeon]
MSEKNSNEVVFLDERVTVGQKVSFGIAGAGVSLLSGIINGPLSVFYTFKLGLTTEKVALAMLIFAIWNALNDPLFGILEDKTQSKLGRRIPYLRYGAPVFGILFIFCWYPFLDLIFANRQWALFANFLLALFLFDTIFTIIGLITYSLPSEMCITGKGRANVQVYSVYLGAIGMLGSMILTTVFLSGTSSAISPWFRPTMIITAFVGSLMVFIPSFNLIENEYAVREEKLGFFQSIVQTFKNTQFLIYEFGNFFYQIAWVVLTGLMAPFVGYVLGYEGIWATIPLLAIFLMVFIFTFPASRLARKWGNKRTYMVALSLSIVLFIELFIMSGKDSFFALIVMTLLGITYAPAALLNAPLYFEIIDMDELLTGKRRETTYAGMNALFTKPAISAANALFFWVVGFFGFIEPTELIPNPIQPESAIFGIRLAYTVIPAAALLFVLFFMIFYKLHGPKWEEKKTKLNQIHLEKEQAYIEELAKEGKVSPTYKKLRRE